MFSLKGALEQFKQQFSNSTNDSEKNVLLNMINFIGMMITTYNIDVLYEKPSNKICLNDFENKKYSQFGEDGITEKIFEIIGFTNKTYLDFGATETENNSEVLHKEYGFSGTLWNGGDISCEYSTVHKEFITNENILDLCKKYKVPDEFDFLSIDIDGNDWYIWKTICENYKPRVVVIEYNASFPPPQDKNIVYDPEFDWSSTHSCYYGASIQAMYNLGRKLGYSLVGVSNMGVNLFFIRDDVVEKHDCFYNMNDVKALYKTPKYGHEPCGDNGNHTQECLETYKLGGIMGHRPDTLERPWVSSLKYI